MTDKVPETLRLYLNDKIDFDTLEDRLILIAFDPQNQEEQDAADLVFAEFFCVRDGVSDEALFRERMAELVGPEDDEALFRERVAEHIIRPEDNSAVAV